MSPSKRLWAPWRMDYISGGKSGGCVFCPDDACPDLRKRLVLFETRFSTVRLNKYPYSSGHLLVAPLRHVPGLDGLGDEETLDLMRLVNRSVAALKQGLGAEGFNMGVNLGKAAGAGIEEHVHVHIVPRWKGDTNFMPVLAEVRVIPEHLVKTYDRLRPLFEGD